MGDVVGVVVDVVAVVLGMCPAENEDEDESFVGMVGEDELWSLVRSGGWVMIGVVSVMMDGLWIVIGCVY